MSWCGHSNGYYSESVYISAVPNFNNLILGLRG